MMKKIQFVGAILVLCMAALCGCGKKEVDFTKMEVTETALAVRAEGKLQSSIVADFDKDYYTVDGLTSYIGEQIEAYERKNGGEITLESVEEKDQKVTAVFSYDSTGSFAGFQNVSECFTGNVSAAVNHEAWPGSFLEAKTSDSVTAEEVEKETKDKVVILCPEEAMQIKVEGTIQYLSGSIYIDEQTASVEAGQTAVVVYEE